MKLTENLSLGFGSAILAGAVAVALAAHPAHATPFIVTAEGTPVPYAIDPANGTPPSTVTLASNAALIPTGGSLIQLLTFNSGYDPVGGPIPFSFNESVSVQDTTSAAHALRIVTISGVFDVSPTTAPDTVTINPTSTFLPSVDLYLNTPGLAFLDNPPFPGGTVFKAFEPTLSLTASVPEPGSLAILGAGLLGFGLLVRRRA